MITFAEQKKPTPFIPACDTLYLLVPLDDLSGAYYRGTKTEYPTLEVVSCWCTRTVSNTDPLAVIGYEFKSQRDRFAEICAAGSPFEVNSEYTNMPSIPWRVLGKSAKKYDTLYFQLPIRQHRDWDGNTLQAVADLRQRVNEQGTSLLVLTPDSEDDSDEVQTLFNRTVRGVNYQGSDADGPPLDATLYQLTYQGHRLCVYAAVFDRRTRPYKPRKPRPKKPVLPSPPSVGDLEYVVSTVYSSLSRFSFDPKLCEGNSKLRYVVPAILHIFGLTQLVYCKKHAYRQLYAYWKMMHLIHGNLAGTLRKYGYFKGFTAWIEAEAAVPGFQRNLRKARAKWDSFKGYSHHREDTLSGETLKTRNFQL